MTEIDQARPVTPERRDERSWIVGKQLDVFREQRTRHGYRKQIIRNRVNGLGVAETEVKRDGDQIVVDLPGSKACGSEFDLALLRVARVIQ